MKYYEDCNDKRGSGNYRVIVPISKGENFKGRISCTVGWLNTKAVSRGCGIIARFSKKGTTKKYKNIIQKRGLSFTSYAFLVAYLVA